VYDKELHFHTLHKALSPRDQVFVSYFLVDLNASKAARKAGFSRRSAGQIGWEVLKKHEIAACIQVGLDLIAARCEVTAEKVMHELAAVAFSNITHFEIKEHGDVALEKDAPAEAIRAVQYVKRTVREDGSITTEYRLWDKLKALELLGKKLKLWVERIETESLQDEVYKLLLKQLKEEQSQATRLDEKSSISWGISPTEFSESHTR
jgi:phage terminase small subunit